MLRWSTNQETGPMVPQGVEATAADHRGSGEEYVLMVSQIIGSIALTAVMALVVLRT